MDPQKSRIDSFDIAMGQAPRISSLQKNLDPWNILVCSDLGFTSLSPQQIRVSEWSDFVASCTIKICGTVANKVSQDHKPVFVEYAVSSLKDFDHESVLRTVQPFASFMLACTILEQLCDAKTSLQDAISSIKKAGLPSDEEFHILTMLHAHPVKQVSPLSNAPVLKTSAALDSILTMVEMPGAPAATASPLKATDVLVNSIAQMSTVTFDKTGVATYIATIRSRLHEQLGELNRLQAFTARSTSWNSLLTLAKVIGRNKEIRLHVVSAGYEECTDSFSDIMAQCMESGFAPDIVLWDYSVSLSNADVDRMVCVATAAELAKTVVVMSLSMEDPFFKDRDNCETISHLLQDVRLIPFQKLRAETASRCLCLVGPALANPADTYPLCGWFIATRFAELCIVEKNPFSVKDYAMPIESVYPVQNVFKVAIAPSIAKEAQAAGFSFLENKLARASLDKIASVLDPAHAEAGYSLFCFNLLVNRVVRLCGMQILAGGTTKTIEDIAAAIFVSVKQELYAYGVILSNDDLVVSVAGGSGINVEINSAVTMSGIPIGFSFAF